MDGVQARIAQTAILASGTPIRTRALLRSIGDEVARAARIARVALKGMIKPEPMADLMHRRLSLVIPILGPIRHRACQNVAPVRCVLVGRVSDGRATAAGLVGDGFGQGAVAQDSGGGGVGQGACGDGGKRGLEVDVQGGVGAAVEGGLHVGVGRVGSPSVVDGEGVGLDVEGDVCGGVGGVKDATLGVESESRGGRNKGCRSGERR